MMFPISLKEILPFLGFAEEWLPPLPNKQIIAEHLAGLADLDSSGASAQVPAEMAGITLLCRPCKC